METLYQILTFVFGGTSVIGTIFSVVWWKQTKRLKEAEVKQKEVEAELAEHDADKAEVERLHMQIDHQQKSLNIYIDLEKKNAERISEQNKSLDEKTEQIRNLTAQLIESEHGRNADKDEIARLMSENSELKLLVAHYKMWHCRKSWCEDRIPPNKKLKGLKYEPPQFSVRQTSEKEIVKQNKQTES